MSHQSTVHNNWGQPPINELPRRGRKLIGGCPQLCQLCPQLLWTVVCGLSLVFTTGCLRRSLTIRTDPPGAFVYLNDTLIGTSPASFDFQWYGWHRVTLRKDGYERVEDRRLIRAPAHLWIPFDLAMEMAPFAVRDDRAWDYHLTPTTTLPEPVPPPAIPTSRSAAQPLPPKEPAPAAAPSAAAPPAAEPETEEEEDLDVR